MHASAQATWLHASQEQSPHYLSRDQLGENWAADADRFAAEEVLMLICLCRALLSNS